MKKLILFLLTLNTSIQSQNLILNADFENRFSCPQYTGDINIDGMLLYSLDSNIYNWTSGLEAAYFHHCVNDTTIFHQSADVPQSFIGYQNARSGEGYIGFCAFAGNPYGVPYPKDFDFFTYCWCYHQQAILGIE